MHLFTHLSQHIIHIEKLVHAHIHSLIPTPIHTCIIWWVDLTVTSVLFQPLQADSHGYTHWNYTSSADTYPKHRLSGQELWIWWLIASAWWLKFTSRTCCQIIYSGHIGNWLMHILQPCSRHILQHWSNERNTYSHIAQYRLSIKTPTYSHIAKYRAHITIL